MHWIERAFVLGTLSVFHERLDLGLTVKLLKQSNNYSNYTLHPLSPHRLAGQVYRQFTHQPTSSLEDLSLGELRPTALIRCYDNLYREGRVDTLDALDSLPELHGLDVLKMKILFSVVVVRLSAVRFGF